MRCTRCNRTSIDNCMLKPQGTLVGTEIGFVVAAQASAFCNAVDYQLVTRTSEQRNQSTIKAVI
jgi:hypothetical protein